MYVFMDYSSQIKSLLTGKYTEQYVQYGGSAMVSEKERVTQQAASAELCAKQCTGQPNNTCKSFDYCDSNQTCFLQSSHYLDWDQQTPVMTSSSSDCVHYSRMYYIWVQYNLTPTHIPKSRIGVFYEYCFLKISKRDMRLRVFVYMWMFGWVSVRERARLCVRACVPVCVCSFFFVLFCIKGTLYIFISYV